jgi:MFS family permease
MMIGCMFVIVASFLAAFAPRNIGAFIGAKALVGIGQGITLPAGPVYISEITPAKTRGAVMSFWQLFFSVGNSMGFIVAFACSKKAEQLGNWDWKIVMPNDCARFYCLVTLGLPRKSAMVHPEKSDRGGSGSAHENPKY